MHVIYLFDDINNIFEMITKKSNAHSNNNYANKLLISLKWLQRKVMPIIVMRTNCSKTIKFTKNKQ